MPNFLSCTISNFSLLNKYTNIIMKSKLISTTYIIAVCLLMKEENDGPNQRKENIIIIPMHIVKNLVIGLTHYFSARYTFKSAWSRCYNLIWEDEGLLIRSRQIIKMFANWPFVLVSCRINHAQKVVWFHFIIRFWNYICTNSLNSLLYNILEYIQ